MRGLVILLDQDAKGNFILVDADRQLDIQQSTAT